ncbi:MULTISPECIES: D-alanyl-D-alanine carboxypeptidase family protein [unclassified Streptomyces]|uniref:D-alanyl-D-alanine carboxypeptidase family protein n=1 Tax=unclassified Streptomyces TaxID=2593676 RepID=UPI0038262735
MSPRERAAQSGPAEKAGTGDGPPPPDAPARAVMRCVKIWTPMLLLLVLVVAGVQLVRPLPDPALRTAADASSYTFDGRFDIPWPAKGQAAVQAQGVGGLGTFGDPRPVPTASVAKVMTAYLILQDHPLKKDEAGPEIEVDAKAVADGRAEDESRIEGLSVGARFSQLDMLKMLMIPSGNNIARLLARWDTASDSKAAFVKKMNDAAERLGMKDTVYTDPSGLDAKTVSTAVDQLKLAEAVMKLDAFRPVVALPNATLKGLAAPLNNNNDNLLLSGLSVKGIKTGSSSAAGGALMWAAYKSVDDKTPLILGTMMDQHVDGPDHNAANSLALVKENSKKVIKAVHNALTSAVAVRKGQTVGYVDDGLGGRTPLVATEDLRLIGIPGHRLALTLSDGGKTLPRSAKSGTRVGRLTLAGVADAPSVPVALEHDLASPSLGSRLTRLA